MSAVPAPRKLTVAEYLMIERVAPFKSEFFDGIMYPVHRDDPKGMAGAKPRHNGVSANLGGELYARLKGTPCRPLFADQRVKVGTSGLYSYPDLLVVCGKREYDPADPMTLTNPTVVFEVLSDSSESYDRGLKFRQYQMMPTVREIVLVSQDEVRVEVHARQADGRWLQTIFDDPAGDFRLTAVAVAIPLADVYRDLDDPPAVSE